MNVLFVVDYYYPHVGGLEIFFQHLAEGCVKQGHSVTVVTVALPHVPLHEYINGVKVHRVRSFRWSGRYGFTFFAIFPLLKLIRKFDIVHTTTYNAAFPAWVAAKTARKKIILTVHEVWGRLWYLLSGMNRTVAFLHKFFESTILKLPFSYLVCDSLYTKQSLLQRNLHLQNVGVIYPGVDYTFFDSSLYSKDQIRKELHISNRYVLTYFGRPGWAKGLKYLILSLQQLIKTIPRVKLLLILSAEPKKPYEHVMQSLQSFGLTDYVILIKSLPRADLPRYLMASDCVVVPSVSEGFGFTVAESCALHLPVVATNAGSIPEVISNRYVLCKPADPTSLTKAIEQMYYGNFNRKEEIKFTWERTVQEYLKLYSQIRLEPRLL